LSSGAAISTDLLVDSQKWQINNMYDLI